MDIKLYTGEVISTTNPDVIEQHLKYGGKEITTSTTKEPKATTNSKKKEAE